MSLGEAARFVEKAKESRQIATDLAAAKDAAPFQAISNNAMARAKLHEADGYVLAAVEALVKHVEKGGSLPLLPGPRWPLVIHKGDRVLLRDRTVADVAEVRPGGGMTLVNAVGREHGVAFHVSDVAEVVKCVCGGDLDFSYASGSPPPTPGSFVPPRFDDPSLDVMAASAPLSIDAGRALDIADAVRLYLARVAALGEIPAGDPVFELKQALADFEANKPTTLAPGLRRMLVYEVREGDTLSEIAQRFGVKARRGESQPWVRLMRVNHMREGVIHPGDLLIIPPNEESGR